MAIINVGDTIETIRIPELPAIPDTPGISVNDLVPIWRASDNKTYNTPLSKLIAFINSGGSTTIVSTFRIGNRIIHIVTHDEDGSQQILIPELEGLIYNMTRGGVPLIPNEEYEILSGGGVKIPDARYPDDQYHEGERLVFDIYDPDHDSGVIIQGGFLTGSYTININQTILVSQLNMLGQIRSTGGGPITATLPNVSDVTGTNSWFVAEATISNDWQTKIKAATGQKIYMNNASWDYVWIAPGETVWLFCKSDGWYVMNDSFALAYRRIGKVSATYKKELGERVANGAEILRNASPRLWEYLAGIGSSLVDKTVWNTANVYRVGNTYSTTDPGGTREVIPRPYRGCFHRGDGSTTFGLPDLMNMFLRGLAVEVGTDNERYINASGMYQPSANKSHTHTPPNDSHGINYGLIPQANSGNNTVGDTDAGPPPEPNIVSAPTAMLTEGHVDARPDNTGVLWVINE